MLWVIPSNLIKIHLQSIMLMYQELNQKPEHVCSHFLLTSTWWAWNSSAHFSDWEKELCLTQVYWHHRKVTESGFGFQVSWLQLQCSLHKARLPSECLPGLVPSSFIFFMSPLPGPPQRVAYFFKLQEEEKERGRWWNKFIAMLETLDWRIDPYG